eukprot:Gb_09144 [translate_table: standard]
MAGGSGSGDSRSLEQTPTWAVAAVCAVFVVISILIEQAIHLVGHKALNEALEKIKAELMLLGFISLLLTVGQEHISKICISKSLGDSMLPCKKKEATDSEDTEVSSEGHRRRLLWGSGGASSSSSELPLRRFLAGGGGSDHCANKGKVSLVSQDGLHQLHIFIFVLAIFHVLYSILTMALGRAKFYRSVPKVDYLTLRHGFISAHLPPQSNFNFHKYIKRSLEDDFKVVVGISPHIWGLAVIFLLLNVYGWYTYFWLSFVPLIIILVVGTKLQVVITEMALQIQNTQAVVKGAPVVQPSDKLFWFSRPQFVLFLIHFVLFQNAFQLAFFCWTWYEFGLKSCFHEEIEIIITRVVMGVGVQFLCSYITFPLYALVTQMGSHMKKAIFEEQTANALKRWHQAAKKKRKHAKKSGVVISGTNTPSQGSSPIHLFHRYKSTGDLELGQTSPEVSPSEYEMSDVEIDGSSSPPIPMYANSVHNTKAYIQNETRAGQHPNSTEGTWSTPSSKETTKQRPAATQDAEDSNSTDFSFVKLPLDASYTLACDKLNPTDPVPTFLYSGKWEGTVENPQSATFTPAHLSNDSVCVPQPWNDSRFIFFICGITLIIFYSPVVAIQLFMASLCSRCLFSVFFFVNGDLLNCGHLHPSYNDAIMTLLGGLPKSYRRITLMLGAKSPLKFEETCLSLLQEEIRKKNLGKNSESSSSTLFSSGKYEELLEVRNVMLGDGVEHSISGRGTVFITMSNGEVKKIDNVLHVPILTKSLHNVQLSRLYVQA